MGDLQLVRPPEITKSGEFASAFTGAVVKRT